MRTPLMIALVALCGFAAAVNATDIDVPLTVTEPAGVARVNEPVSAGVPLPVGAVNGVLASLRMGALPRHIDYRRLAESARGILAARVVEAAVGGTRKDAAAALQFAGALRVVHELVESTVDPNGAVLDAFQQMQLVADTSRLPTIAELCGSNHTVDLQPSVEPEGDDFNSVASPAPAVV